MSFLKYRVINKTPNYGLSILQIPSSLYRHHITRL